MSEKEAREFDRKRLVELYNIIDPCRNEHIAREAVTIANKWLTKAENQAVQIKNLENRAQRMRGKWEVTPIYIKCSECGACYLLIPQNYCPNCGADMRGTE